MSIRTKILLACLSLTALTLVFGVVSRHAQTQLAQNAVRLYDEAFMSMSYLRSAQNTLLTLSRDVATGNVAPARVAPRLETAVEDIGVAVERALSPRGRRAAAELQAQLRTILDDYHREQRLPPREVLTALENRFDDAVEINAGDGFRSRRVTKELIAQISFQTWAAMIASLGLALAITFVLGRAIVPALRHAVGVATAIASGKLDNPIVAYGRSETAALLRALAIMQRSIAGQIARIEQLMAEQASHHATEMASQNMKFETALDNMVQGLCMFDPEGRVLVHNKRFAEMFAAAEPGAPITAALPSGVLPVAGTSAEARVARSYTRTLPDERIIAITEKPMKDGGWIATYEDVTDRLRTEARIAQMARHDALTGLPNRLFYREQMSNTLSQLRRGRSIAVLYVDIDDFKTINDTLGHAVGDALLCAVAERLHDETRASDTVVRLGGDEFAIIQFATIHEIEARTLAERLRWALAEPYALGDATDIRITISIGIAVSSDRHDDPESLLKAAEIALYKAKEDGRNSLRFFEADMGVQLQSRRRLEVDLRTAVAERQFVNYYQPMVAVATREVCGFESLTRWCHPERGMIAPGEFIPVAEETGLIVEIGMQVLEAACVDALSWPNHIKVAVNLSPVQFRTRNVAADIAGVLERTGFPGSRLELELTESVLLRDSDSVLSTLRELRALGIRISMDDFGTGYSSLSYLHRFPFDKIKIDQSFVRDLDKGEDCVAIIRAVLGLGRSLGMIVTAEGVETEAQFLALQREGCEQVQGYLFSKPAPVTAIAPLLAKQIEFAA